jgi:hypothetical protein
VEDYVRENLKNDLNYSTKLYNPQFYVVVNGVRCTETVPL